MLRVAGPGHPRLLVRAGCRKCGAVDSVVFNGDGAHAPFGTCCAEGRVIWQADAGIEWI